MRPKKSNNKAYSKVLGALLSKFLCSADISNPFSWGEGKERIPPNVTKAGSTPADVNIGLSQIPGSCLRCGLKTYQRVRNPQQSEVRLDLLKVYSCVHLIKIM